MIVTFHTLLVVVAQKVGGDGFRLTEIHTGIADIGRIGARYPLAVHRQVIIGHDLQALLANIAVGAVGVKIAVIGEIDRTGLI